MYTISEFSAVSRLTVKALRLYHDEGLLVPDAIDPDNGYRWYGEASCRRAEAIQLLRELGFPLREMKSIFDSCEDDTALQTFFRIRLAEVERNLAVQRAASNRIRYFLEDSKEEKMQMTDEITEIKIDDIRIAGIRYKGKYSDIGGPFSEIFKKAGRYCAGKPFALYYDCDYHEDDADIEAAVQVRKDIQLDGLSCRVISGGKAVSVFYRGPYEHIGEGYKRVLDYIGAHGYTALSPTREIYHKGPGLIFPRDPKKFVTEIQILVK